jgi:uncharacterized protein (TIGR02145 family)
MSLLKLKERGLLALLFLVFSACDKILPPGGNGVDIPVTIRAVAIAGGAQNETITRTGGASRMVGEPIVQDLGGGVFAEITVEEDLSALRATPYYGPLADEVKFRVIAVNSSDNKVYSYADYTTGSGDINRDAGTPELHVLSGGSYYFVCISYNNSDLPPAPALNATLSTVSVTAGSNDLLWGTTGEPKTINGDPELSFTLSHKLVKAQLTLEVAAGKTITNIDNSKISLDAPSSGSFNLKKEEGEFSSLSGNTVFTWPSTAPHADTAESNPITFIPKATERYTFSFAEGAVTRSDETGMSAAWTSYFVNSKFTAGGSYTIAVKLYKKTSNKFAGSNIFWDGSKLTFDENGNNDNTKYQGVYFKWGSLIGISPVGNYSNDTSNGTILYWPTNTSASAGTTRTWNAVTGGTGWTDIPYQNSTAITTTNKDAHSLLANPDFAAYKGDICNYINPAYRMPTADELEALYSSNGYSGFSATAVTSTDAAGKQVFSQFGTFTSTGTSYVLPASGYRVSSDGALNVVGSFGNYWSGSASNSSSAYELDFLSSNAYVDYVAADRSYSQPVRCVKME